MDKARIIEVKKNVLGDNDQQAQALREELRQKRTFMLNLMSSPGSGKTTAVLRTIAMLQDSLKIGVIEADIDSSVDADRILAAGFPAVQLRTNGLCHLDARMTREGVAALGEFDLDMIILENIGNLICPAEYDTGASKNVMILSVPEGDDKPLKYPIMFSACDALLISKIDVLDHFNFDFAAVEARVRKLNPGMAVFGISAKTGQGIDAWTDWLHSQVRQWIQ
jgi:hydrogenase accessory protein HypB